jgi:hypothetical protein
MRRVTTLHVRAGMTQRAVRACAAGERLVSGAHAIGFYTSRPPSAALVSSVRARQQLSADRIMATVRSTYVVSGVRAIVQVSAVCAGGR